MIPPWSIVGLWSGFTIEWQQFEIEGSCPAIIFVPDPLDKRALAKRE